jgi:hypothetical protein
MRNSPEPSLHRQREEELIRHVQRLLEDDRLRVDTTRGRRPVTTLIRDVNESDKGVELKRLMSQKGVPDRELEAKMPVGRSMEVVLSRRKWGDFQIPRREAASRVRVANGLLCLPTKRPSRWIHATCRK